MTFAELVKKYIPLPWASGSTLKNDIPATRSTGLPSNRATYTEGFPEITMQPVLKNSDNTLQADSGIPPSGYDFNGVLNTVTNEIYNNKLMGLAYGDWDSTVSTTYGGYPQGAIVSYPAGAQTNKTFYLSQVDNNTSTPTSSTQWTALFSGRYVISASTAEDAPNWWRVWSDGWIEQGGQIPWQNNAGETTIRFPVAFTNAASIRFSSAKRAVISIDLGRYNYSGEQGYFINVTTTQFTTGWNSWGPTDWEAKGF